MADITYNFSIGKGKKLRVLWSVLKAMKSGKFVVKTPDLQPNVEPMDFSEAGFKEMKRQRNHFANQNAILRRKLAGVGVYTKGYTGRPMTPEEAKEVDAVFEEVDKVFDQAEKVFDHAGRVFPAKYGVRIIRRKYE